MGSYNRHHSRFDIRLREQEQSPQVIQDVGREVVEEAKR